MKILVTGAKGFIGKNLISTLKCKNNMDIFEFDIDTDISLLDEYTKNCEFVFHLAGINRPKDEKEFMESNYGFTTALLNKLEEFKNTSPILITSSIQAELDNPYGKSKKAGEEVLHAYEKKTGSKILIYRLSNVFGKWCRPHYNSVIATFCNNVGNDLPIQVKDPDTIMNLVYIDDVVEEFTKALYGKENRSGDFCEVPVLYTVKLGKIAELIKSFNESRKTLNVPDMSDAFVKKLYSTYLSYLPTNQFSYPLNMNIDNRGSFTEILRTIDRGQFSVNIIKPGITKGNHWHNTKNEKFVVVSGIGSIRFRRVETDEIIEYLVSGNNIEVVDIPTGYTHSITNVGDTDLVTFMWCNECFNPDNPDTMPLIVDNNEKQNNFRK